MSCIEGKGGLKDIHCTAQKPRYLILYHKISLVSELPLSMLMSYKWISSGKWLLIVYRLCSYIIYECNSILCSYFSNIMFSYLFLFMKTWMIAYKTCFPNKKQQFSIFYTCTTSNGYFVPKKVNLMLLFSFSEYKYKFDRVFS